MQGNLKVIPNEERLIQLQLSIEIIQKSSTHKKALLKVFDFQNPSISRFVRFGNRLKI